MLWFCGGQSYEISLQFIAGSLQCIIWLCRKIGKIKLIIIIFPRNKSKAK